MRSCSPSSWPSPSTGRRLAGRLSMNPSKRIFDLLVAGTILVVTVPIAVICALAVKLYDGGPALYRGERVGLLGRRFQLLKFRTMVADAGRLGGTSTPEDDPRLTPFGRVMRRWK